MRRITPVSRSSVRSLKHGVALLFVSAAVTLAACSADSPTGVADRRIPAPKARGEHLVCAPQGEGDISPADTVSLPPSGTCPIGFDSVIWW